ncbi:hypothetical protein QZH41_006228 [Actinostola sp. cb2023]|nr:hypothetical protein QZH41_006228 [Actinostola sp. cb2023]
MWVKSRNPGFIRWFDENDSPNKGFFASTKSASVGRNRWTHLAGTFDTTSGVARIYVNGKLRVEKVGKKNNGLPQDFTSTGIGRKYGDSHVTFLDDVYMFDRVITPEQVAALYKKCQFNRMILHYGFQHWNEKTRILDDQSGLQNNATLKGGAKLRTNADCDKCGGCLDLQADSNSQVYLNSTKYRQKPTSAVSISAWVNLNRTKGLHSIFQAGKDGNTNNSVYNLEIIDGKVHWQCKDNKGNIIFDGLTNEVTIPEGLWSHVTGTYSAKTGNAKIYVQSTDIVCNDCGKKCKSRGGYNRHRAAKHKQNQNSTNSKLY